MSDTQGTVHWNELMTKDVEAAKEFYAKVCGWSFTTAPMPFGDYTMGMANGAPVAGIMDMSGMPDADTTDPFWMTYIAVDDVDAAARAVTAGGGTVENGPFDVPNVGRIAITRDPGGARIGIMTPAPDAQG
jgi:hypothetical protein